MCQPKSKGGKRCLAHSNVSKYSVRNVSVKTGASPEVVQKTLVELSREGKNVEQPTNKEVETFIDQQRFKTEIDPELDAHERKIQLNQLDRAKEEVKAGVSGGAWHAWKNIHKTVKAKMKAAKKAVVAVGLMGALTFSLAGCGGALNNNNPNTPAPTSTSTSQPTESPAPSNEPTVAPETPPSVPTTVTGDSVVKTDANGNPVTITDEYGSYTPTTINPNDDSLTVNPSTVSANVNEAGWTAEDVSSGQKYIVTFVAEQTADSIALDRTTGWDKWKNEVAPQYLDSQWQDSILNSSATGTDRAVPISNNFNNITPDLTRNGGPRLSSSNISVNEVDSANVNGAEMLIYGGTYEATYNTVGGKPLTTKSTWKYSVVKSADSWSITGYDNHYDYFQ